MGWRVQHQRGEKAGVRDAYSANAVVTSRRAFDAAEIGPKLTAACGYRGTESDIFHGTPISALAEAVSGPVSAVSAATNGMDAAAGRMP